MGLVKEAFRAGGEQIDATNREYNQEAEGGPRRGGAGEREEGTRKSGRWLRFVPQRGRRVRMKGGLAFFSRLGSIRGGRTEQGFGRGTLGTRGRTSRRVGSESLRFSFSLFSPCLLCGLI